MIREIVRDTLFLSQPSLEASQADISIGQDLLDTLLANKDSCVGLAANMIGYHKRVIVIMMGELPLVMFNPELLAKDKAYQTEEGCLSLSGTRLTRRYEQITVRFQNMAWQTQTLTLQGFPAQICQHELDHLEGILI